MSSLKKNISFVNEIGIKKSVMILINRISEYLFDLKYGIDTVSRIDLKDLGIDSENVERGGKYQPTRIKSFKKLLRKLNLPKDSFFVDLGSGKGRILLLASEYGFEKVLGVEFSHKLCEIAKKNIDSFKRKKGKGNIDIEVIEEDITKYQFNNSEDVFFMFNPIDELLMKKFLLNLKKSIKVNPRKTTIIYHYLSYSANIDDYGKLIESDDTFYKVGEYRLGDSVFVINSNEKQSN